LLLGLAALIIALAGQPVWLLVWLVLSLAAFTIYSFRKNGLGKAFSALVARFMVLYGTVFGFFMGRKDTGPYPTSVMVVQQQPIMDLNQEPGSAKNQIAVVWEKT
jgi:hypothetical protein